MRDPVPPLRTELSFKPTNIAHLEQEVGGFGCERESMCRVQNCFSDREHLIFSGNPEEPLTEAENLLKSHPDFIVPAICRWKHMRINVTWDRSEPISDEFAIGYLIASPLNLCASKMKRLKKLRRGL